MANSQSIRKLSNEERTNVYRSRAQYEFELDIEIRRIDNKPLFETYGKLIYEAEWIDRDGPSINLVELKGIETLKKASYYVQLSSHRHILRTYGIVRSNELSTIFLQENSPQGNLRELFLENEFQPNENVLMEIFEQICSGMIYLIDQNIIHGNLTCRNILVFQINPRNPKKNLIKLTDFALIHSSELYSMIDDSQSTLINSISTRYAPPEFLKDLHRIEYSDKTDIYSMGILMWEACNYGQIPYENIHEKELIRQEKIQGKFLPKPSMCSDDLWMIIQNCCHLQPNKRPTFRSLKQDIEHLKSHKFESQIISNVLNTDLTIIPLQINHQNEDQRFYSDESVDISHIDRTNHVICPFCNTNLSSLEDFHEHLIQCGSKTDQCPRCERFIQRAVFVYHYENNCAQIKQTDIDNATNNIMSREIQPNKHQISNNSSELIKCEFCQQYSTLNEYHMHRDYCIHNPENYPKTSRTSVDILRSGIPCEFCRQNYSTDKLQQHQSLCSKNPNVRLSPTVEQPTTNNSQTTPTNERGEEEEEEPCCCCCS